MKFIFFILSLSCVEGAFYCPKMECLEANNTDSSMGSNYTCYKWTSGDFVSSNLHFKVRKCPHVDQTCDFFGQDDKSIVKSAFGNPNAFKESVFGTLES